MTYRTHWPALLAVLVPAALAGCHSESDALAEADVAESYAEAPDLYPADGASFDEPAAAFDRFPKAEDRAAAAPAAPARRLASTSAAPPDAPADLGRQLRRSASLRLSTDTYDATLGQARAVAGRFGGLVAGEDGATVGETSETTLTLRVPSARFDAALDALAALGTVETRHVSVDDVTGQVVDLEARLRAQRAAEARYVAFVEQSATVPEMLDVQRRLDGVRAEIEVMESQARALRGSVSLSTIQATVVGPAPVPAPPPGLWAAAADAVVAGWRGLWAVVIGVLPLWPVAVGAGAALVAWRRLAPRVTAQPPAA